MQFNHKINIKQQFTYNNHVIKQLNTTFEKLQFSPQTLQKLHFCPRSGNYLILTQISQQNYKLTLKIYSTHQNWLFDKSLQNYILALIFENLQFVPHSLFSFQDGYKTIFEFES